MELNEEEKRQLFQVDGDCQAKVLDELYMTARFTRNPEQRDMVRGLMAKLRVLSDEQCMDLVKYATWLSLMCFLLNPLSAIKAIRCACFSRMKGIRKRWRIRNAALSS